MLFPDIDHPWETKPLGKLFQLSSKGINPANFPREKFLHYSIPAWDELGGPVLNSGGEIDSGKLLLDCPCVLVSKLNPQIPRVRSFEPPTDGVRVCASTEIMPYIPRDANARIDFFKHYFLSDRFRRNLVSAATGTTNSHRRVRPPQTLQWLVPSPGPEEQTAIARVLDAVDAAIDRAREAFRRAQEAERALTADAFDRMDAETRQLGEFATDVRYGTSQASSERGWGNPVLRIPNVVGDQLTLDDLAYVDLRPVDVDRLALSDGDLLLVRTNGNPNYVGRSAVFRRPDDRTWVYASYLIRVRLAGALLPDYVNVFLGSERGRRELLRRVTTSAGNHNINSNSIRLLLIPVPCDIGTQEEVVRLAEASRQVATALGGKLLALYTLKKSLMHDLLTGAVRVIPALLAQEAAE
jgi:type I restriction enzyme S subunit